GLLRRPKLSPLKLDCNLQQYVGLQCGNCLKAIHLSKPEKNDIGVLTKIIKWTEIWR
ncbi:hypothetical protein L9F63_001000, partial [Diploptera punctata]